ncbi:carbohydrate porin [Acidobacteriota bacterium]
MKHGTFDPGRISLLSDGVFALFDPRLGRSAGHGRRGTLRLREPERSNDGGTLYEGSVSTGFGFKPARGVGFWGIGLNWARPNENTFGAELNDQYTLETYFRLQLTQRFQLTPSIQYLKNPAANPLQSSLFVFGLRARAAF